MERTTLKMVGVDVCAHKQKSKDGVIIKMLPQQNPICHITLKLLNPSNLHFFIQKLTIDDHGGS